MNATHFDRLVHAVGNVSSRRAVMGGLAGALGLAAIQVPEALVAKKRKKKCREKCGPCRTCKKGKCKPRPPGTACGDGAACLANGSCAQICTIKEECEPLDSGCGCSPPSVEGTKHCYGHVNSCEEIPQLCESSAECQRGHVCQPTGCTGGHKRCWPLCPV